MRLLPRHAAWRTALAAIMVLSASAAGAHHGWGGYDSNAVLKVTGNVEASAFENPHGEMQLRTQDKVWHVILAPPSRMQNRGLTPAMLKTGATATVEGYPSKSDPQEMRAERITVDGKTVELR